ncbi:TauD/TfdA family dioxygenase [Streptomyces sp. NPDC014894]|uniref:TauD/TfdA family dioxygenase n=1 Tax=Streptomyces sp. NPDC014894 TaxID=3364931 RepID=UPI003702FE1F
MAGSTLPLTVDGDGGPASDAVRADRDALRERLYRHGALLLRGFDVGGVDGFEAVVRELSGAPLTYTEQSSPRSVIKGKVYTSTEYPAKAEIPLHNEMSYQASWPLVLYFHCVEPPLTQGATPLASTRIVHDLIDPAVREEFVRRKWMAVRNYRDDIGLRWWQAFGTESREEVERLCEAGGIEVKWIGKSGLRTRAVREPVHRHPVTGDAVWFNHVVIFHVSSLPAPTRTGLLEICGEEGLPNNTYYGDGEPIPDDVTGHLRDCYRRASVRFDYRRDDLLIVDNMLASHGREPFTGPRRIAVAMGEASDA